jgi:hypothetical protein
MFEVVVDITNEIIAIVEDPVSKAIILAGHMGAEAKTLLKWWLGHAIAMAVDSCEKFNSHYRQLRKLYVTHERILNEVIYLIHQGVNIVSGSADV